MPLSPSNPSESVETICISLGSLLLCLLELLEGDELRESNPPPPPPAPAPPRMGDPAELSKESLRCMLATMMPGETGGEYSYSCGR